MPSLAVGGWPVCLRMYWHFDHDVGVGHGLPQAARLVDGALCVAREVRRDLEAHIAVSLLRALVDGREQVGGILNIADGQQFIRPLASRSERPASESRKILILG